MSNTSSLFDMPYLPLLIRLECKEPARLPPFLGSTLHGVVGWALRQQPETYAYLFENRRLGGGAQDIVNPYIIEPPRTRSVYRPGEILSFGLILLGDAVQHAESVVQLLAGASPFRLGAERKAFALVDVLQGERYRSVWSAGRWDGEAAAAENLSVHAQREHARWCSVHLTTPLRIRRGGALVQTIDFGTIIRSITRRIETLTERYGGSVDREAAAAVCERASEVRMISSALHLSEMHRYSTRKRESVDWSGMLGVLVFEGELSPFTPWLQAARILHIGRNSTFGCGQLDVVYR